MYTSVLCSAGNGLARVQYLHYPFQDLPQTVSLQKQKPRKSDISGSGFLQTKFIAVFISYPVFDNTYILFCEKKSASHRT